MKTYHQPEFFPGVTMRPIRYRFLMTATHSSLWSGTWDGMCWTDRC
jgi:hypothetical protein